MGVGTYGGVSLTCHMRVSPLRLPSSNLSSYLCNIMVVEVNVDVQPLSHIRPMDISAPY